MYGLSKEEKLKFIVKTSKEMGVTSNEYGDNTKISTMGAHNILTGSSKNPRVKNLNIMLEYLINLQQKKRVYNKDEVLSLVEEPSLDINKHIPKITKDRVVPFYNLEISGSNINNFDDAKEFIEFYIDYKPLNDCTAYLPYFGNSMYPMYTSGNTLAVQQITNFDIILWGEPHLIFTSPNANNYKTVKCIHKHNEESKIILRAINPKYEGDIIINKSDILSLYLVKGKIELNEL